MDEQALLSAVHANPEDNAFRLIAADWYAEKGMTIQEDSLRNLLPPCKTRNVFGNGHGYGDGYGNGDGHGYGYGNGYGHGNGYGNGYGHGDGYGHGHGHGNGYGNGDGYGHGNGYGNGYGNGDGTVKTNNGGLTKMPEIGFPQLIILTDGWVICGLPIKQLGPYHFEIENASLICLTGGTPWDDLARGKGRNKATFRYWGRVTIGPGFVMSYKWEGKLPTEAENKKNKE